jgi:hypothetical protein
MELALIEAADSMEGMIRKSAQSHDLPGTRLRRTAAVAGSGQSGSGGARAAGEPAGACGRSK